MARRLFDGRPERHWKALRKQLRVRQRDRCAICRRPFVDGDPDYMASLDHVVPGVDEAWNLRLVHMIGNRFRSDLSMRREHVTRQQYERYPAAYPSEDRWMDRWWAGKPWRCIENA